MMCQRKVVLRNYLRFLAGKWKNQDGSRLFPLKKEELVTLILWVSGYWHQWVRYTIQAFTINKQKTASPCSSFVGIRPRQFFISNGIRLMTHLRIRPNELGFFPSMRIRNCRCEWCRQICEGFVLCVLDLVSLTNDSVKQRWRVDES